MDAAKWKQIRAKAKAKTDAELADSVAALCNLSEDELSKIVPKAIDEDSLDALMKIVGDATKSNKAKATAIRNIAGLAEIAIGLAKKLA